MKIMYQRVFFSFFFALYYSNSSTLPNICLNCCLIICRCAFVRRDNTSIIAFSSVPGTTQERCVSSIARMKNASSIRTSRTQITLGIVKKFSVRIQSYASHFRTVPLKRLIHIERGRRRVRCERRVHNLRGARQKPRRHIVNTQIGCSRFNVNFVMWLDFAYSQHYQRSLQS
jgi:hypothetical protein